MYPVLVAVQELGDSGSNRDIIRHVVDGIPDGEEASEIVYADGKSILEDRIAWALSYCKLTSVLERPRRGLYLLTRSGREILELGEEAARERLLEMERLYRREAAAQKKQAEDEEAERQRLQAINDAAAVTAAQKKKAEDEARRKAIEKQKAK